MRKSLIFNQKGQAVTELSLMMAFLAAILMGMIFISVFLSANVSTIEKLRFEMRLSMFQNAHGPFKKNIKEKTVIIDLPGRTKQIFNSPFLRHRHHIEFYEGAYTGRGNSYYVLREPYRIIEL